MRISLFWVVTIPNKNSTIEDIVFCTTPKGIIRQANGGLTENELYGVYEDRDKAIEKGNELLELHKTVRPDLH